MIDIKIVEGRLYNYNMLILNEEINEKLLERLICILELDMNTYQERLIKKSIEQLQFIKKLVRVQESALLF